MSNSQLQQVGFRMTRKGLEVTGEPTFEQWLEQWDSLIGIHRAVQWAIADMILYAEEKAAWGEKYAQAMDATQLDYHYLVNIVSVARAYQDKSRRRDNLSFSHHERVKVYPPDIQDQALDAAVEQHLTRDETRQLADTLYHEQYQVDDEPDPEPQRIVIYDADPFEPQGGIIYLNVTNYREQDKGKAVRYFVTLVREVDPDA